MIILTPISLRQYQVIASLSEISGALERLSFGVICCELLWLLFFNRYILHFETIKHPKHGIRILCC